jgi:hypothetical protein
MIFWRNPEAATATLHLKKEVGHFLENFDQTSGEHPRGFEGEK